MGQVLCEWELDTEAPPTHQNHIDPRDYRLFWEGPAPQSFSDWLVYSWLLSPRPDPGQDSGGLSRSWHPPGCSDASVHPPGHLSSDSAPSSPSFPFPFCSCRPIKAKAEDSGFSDSPGQSHTSPSPCVLGLLFVMDPSRSWSSGTRTRMLFQSVDSPGLVHQPVDHRPHSASFKPKQNTPAPLTAGGCMVQSWCFSVKQGSKLQRLCAPLALFEVL